MKIVIYNNVYKVIKNKTRVIGYHTARIKKETFPESFSES